jgi:hypothetical protein
MTLNVNEPLDSGFTFASNTVLLTADAGWTAVSSSVMATAPVDDTLFTIQGFAVDGGGGGCFLVSGCVVTAD